MSCKIPLVCIYLLLSATLIGAAGLTPTDFIDHGDVQLQELTRADARYHSNEIWGETREFFGQPWDVKKVWLYANYYLILFTDVAWHRIVYMQFRGCEDGWCCDWIRTYGSYGSGAGQFRCPKGMHVGSSSGVCNILVVDSGNGRIVRLRYTLGDDSLTWVETYGEDEGLLNPSDIEWEDECMWVLDSGNDRILKYSANGDLITSYGSHGSGEGCFDNPTSLAMVDLWDWPHPTWNAMYVTDAGNQRIVKLRAPGWLYWDKVRAEPGTYLAHIEADSSGVYVLDTHSSQVLGFDTSLTYQTFAYGSRGTDTGQFMSARSISLWTREGTNEFAVVDAYAEETGIQHFLLDNHCAPQIETGPTVHDQPVYENHSHAVTVEAFDRNSDPLSYNWGVEGKYGEEGTPGGPLGQVTGGGDSVTYKAPSLPKGEPVRYYNRIIVEVSDNHGYTAVSTTPWFRIYRPGCPFIHTWDADELAEENNIIPPVVPGEVVDYYELSRPPAVDTGGRLVLRIEESSDFCSYFNQSTLLSVDHPEHIEIGVTTRGEIVGYQNAISPFSCVDEQGDTCTDVLVEPDTQFYGGNNGTVVTMEFAPDPQAATHVLDAATAVKVGPAESSIIVQVKDQNEVWQDVDTLRPRANWSNQAVTLLSIPGSDTLKVRLQWTAYHKLDYVTIGELVEETELKVQVCSLYEASHSEKGGIADELMESDTSYADLVLGEEIELVFSPSEETPNWQRDFVLVSRGYTKRELFTEHPPKIYTGHLPADITVIVCDALSLPVESAYVCLDQPSCSLSSGGYTDNQGKITFCDFSACWQEGGDSVCVTVEKVAYSEYQGHIDIRRGCPYLMTWNGTGFIEENNVIPPSTKDEGVDYYKLETWVVAEPGEPPGRSQYKLQLKEYDRDHSFLDQTKLLAVDHPNGTEIGVTDSGSVVVWTTLIPPGFCEDNEGVDHLALVNETGDTCFEGHAGDTLILAFGMAGPPVYIAIFAEEKSHPASILVQLLDDTVWVDVDTIHPRMNWAPVLTDLSSWVDSLEDSLTTRLCFLSRHKLDYVGVFEPLETTTDMWNCKLLEATHSSEGSVRSQLYSVDGSFAELLGGEAINLGFAVPGMTKPERDLIFITTGYFIEEGGPPAIEVMGPLPLAFELFPTYPNPFTSEIAIRYALPKKARLKVAVYDAAGRLIKILTDSVGEPGYHVLNWKGTDSRGRGLSSGVYFVRMESDKFKSTRKVVLVK